MTTRPIAYDESRDYMRIRQFLIDTYAMYGRPMNWLIERWNFCRYHVLPLHTHYNVRYFGVPTRPHRSHRDELSVWEATIGVWENEGGEIVGVVHTENEEAGEAWFQIHPEYTHLADELVDFAEDHLADRVDDVAFLKVYAFEGTELERVVRSNGYKRLRHGSTYCVCETATAPEALLPDGYVIKSVAEEDDVDKRRIAKSIAFGGGYAPSDWDPAAAFREMQRAPDYRPELDLFVVAPNGDYASLCTIWLDEANRYGNFEPVGTHDEYQGRGLGRALLHEGLRRMAARGIDRSYMDSGNPFYEKVGFHKTPYTRYPWIKYL